MNERESALPPRRAERFIETYLTFTRGQSAGEPFKLEADKRFRRDLGRVARPNRWPPTVPFPMCRTLFQDRSRNVNPAPRNLSRNVG